MWLQLPDTGGLKSMNRIQEAFQNKKILIPFITAGDPDLSVTKELIVAMANCGAGIIEIGIPFSDPVAEGEVIQKADERALAAGTTTDTIFEMVREVRKETDVPLAFMTYINPVYTYGVERFMEATKACGIDGIIVPDLPIEEKDVISDVCKTYGITQISLIAPTSQERIKVIAKEAEGFVYCVSSMGVTGVRQYFAEGIEEMVALVKAEKNIPCAIGFGISTPEQARDMVQKADGVIIGSAIVKIVEQYGRNCVEPVCKYICSILDAIK